MCIRDRLNSSANTVDVENVGFRLANGVLRCDGQSVAEVYSTLREGGQIDARRRFSSQASTLSNETPARRPFVLRSAAQIAHNCHRIQDELRDAILCFPLDVQCSLPLLQAPSP